MDQTRKEYAAAFLVIILAAAAYTILFQIPQGVQKTSTTSTTTSTTLKPAPKQTTTTHAYVTEQPPTNPQKIRESVGKTITGEVTYSEVVGESSLKVIEKADAGIRDGEYVLDEIALEDGSTLTISNATIYVKKLTQGNNTRIVYEPPYRIIVG